MVEHLPLAEDFDALSRARAGERAQRGRNGRSLRAVLWLARVVFGVLPVWSVALVVLWDSAAPTRDGPALAWLGALVLHIVLVCGAILPLRRPVGTDRRISTVALGVSAGLVLSYALAAAGILAMLVADPDILRSGLSSEQDSMLDVLIALGLLVAPVSLVACCAWDVVRDVSALRGRAFGFRDCGWILLGLLLPIASSASVAGVWPMPFLR